MSLIWHQSKAPTCDFLLVINSYLALFLRYGDLLAENCEFFLPHSHLTPSLRVNPLEFQDVPYYIAKIRVVGLSIGEDFLILACIVLTQCQRATDTRRMDGRTDRHTVILTIASTGLCIASYTDAL